MGSGLSICRLFGCGCRHTDTGAGDAVRKPATKTTTDCPELDEFRGHFVRRVDDAKKLVAVIGNPNNGITMDGLVAAGAAGAWVREECEIAAGCLDEAQKRNPGMRFPEAQKHVQSANEQAAAVEYYKKIGDIHAVGEAELKAAESSLATFDAIDAAAHESMVALAKESQ